jgi:HEPN domain-containing protein
MREEAKNCWRQAEEDLITAQANIRVSRYYASVFFSQQAAEKALKAYYIVKLKKLPQSHNLVDMAHNLKANPEIMSAARELNPEYLVTRYVDAANGVPADMYDKKSAIMHLKCAQEILAWVRKKIR